MYGNRYVLFINCNCCTIKNCWSKITISSIKTSVIPTELPRITFPKQIFQNLIISISRNEAISHPVNPELSELHICGRNLLYCVYSVIIFHFNSCDQIGNTSPRFVFAVGCINIYTLRVALTGTLTGSGKQNTF